MADYKVTVGVDIEDSELRGLESRLEQLTDRAKYVDVNVDVTKTQLDDLKSDLASITKKPYSVKVDVDDDDVSKKLGNMFKDVERQANSTSRKIETATKKITESKLKEQKSVLKGQETKLANLERQREELLANKYGGNKRSLGNSKEGRELKALIDAQKEHVNKWKQIVSDSEKMISGSKASDRDGYRINVNVDVDDSQLTGLKTELKSLTDNPYIVNVKVDSNNISQEFKKAMDGVERQAIDASKNVDKAFSKNAGASARHARATSSTTTYSGSRSIDDNSYNAARRGVLNASNEAAEEAAKRRAEAEKMGAEAAERRASVERAVADTTERTARKTKKEQLRRAQDNLSRNRRNLEKFRNESEERKQKLGEEGYAAEEQRRIGNVEKYKAEVKRLKQEIKDSSRKASSARAKAAQDSAGKGYGGKIPSKTSTSTSTPTSAKDTVSSSRIADDNTANIKLKVTGVEEAKREVDEVVRYAEGKTATINVKMDVDENSIKHANTSDDDVDIYSEARERLVRNAEADADERIKNASKQVSESDSRIEELKEDNRYRNKSRENIEKYMHDLLRSCDTIEGNINAAQRRIEVSKGKIRQLSEELNSDGITDDRRVQIKQSIARLNASIKQDESMLDNHYIALTEKVKRIEELKANATGFSDSNSTSNNNISKEDSKSNSHKKRISLLKNKQVELDEIRKLEDLIAEDESAMESMRKKISDRNKKVGDLYYQSIIDENSMVFDESKKKQIPVKEALENERKLLDKEIAELDSRTAAYEDRLKKLDDKILKAQNPTRYKAKKKTYTDEMFVDESRPFRQDDADDSPSSVKRTVRQKKKSGSSDIKDVADNGEVKIGADTDEAKRKIDDIVDYANRQRAEIKVDADSTMRDMDSVGSKPIETDVVADTGDARREIESLDDKPLNLDVDVDKDDDYRKIAELLGKDKYSNYKTDIRNANEAFKDAKKTEQLLAKAKKKRQGAADNTSLAKELDEQIEHLLAYREKLYKDWNGFGYNQWTTAQKNALKRTRQGHAYSYDIKEAENITKIQDALASDEYDAKISRLKSQADSLGESFRGSVTSIDDCKDALERMKKANADNDIEGLIKANQDYQRAVKKTTSEIGMAKDAEKEYYGNDDSLNKKMNSSGIYRMGAYALFDVAFEALAQGAMMAAQAILEVDTAMAELYRVTDFSDQKYDLMFTQMTEAAKECGTSLSDMITSVANWSKAGFEADVAQDMAKVSTMYQQVTDLTVDEADQNIITGYKGFENQLLEKYNNVAEAGQHVGDIYNELGNNYAVTADGIGEGLERSASALSLAGNTIEESAA